MFLIQDRTRMHMHQSAPHAVKVISFKLLELPFSVHTYLDRTGVGFNVDDITHNDLFFKDSLIDTRIQFKLFRSLYSLESYDNVRDGFSISTERVFGFCGRQFRDFALIDFFCFFYPQTCGTGEINTSRFASNIIK